MTKVVYNNDIDGFYWGVRLSEQAIQLARELSGYQRLEWDGTHFTATINRSDPVLVAVIERLGERANGIGADLRIAEVAPGSRYRIDEYDGNERVMTVDDYDWEIAK